MGIVKPTFASGIMGLHKGMQRKSLVIIALVAIASLSIAGCSSQQQQATPSMGNATPGTTANNNYLAVTIKPVTVPQDDAKIVFNKGVETDYKLVGLTPV